MTGAAMRRAAGGRVRARWAGLVLAALTLISALIALVTGASGVGWREVLSLLRGSADGATLDIVVYLRLPRIAAAWLCGAALALSGLTLQAALGNALAAPGVIGVNSGAGLAVLLAAVLIPGMSALTRAGAAFFGALGAALTVYGIARAVGASRRTILLAGVALSSLLSAGIDALTTLVPDALADRAAFYVGGFSGVYWQSVAPAIAPLGLGVLGAALLASRLNILLLGDESAASLGLNVGLCRFLCIVCAALLAAAAVSVCGLLGFVGLIVPHAARFLFGSDYRRLVPLTLLGGGLMVLACDTAARLALAPYELPVGILLSAIGAPFFLSLLLRKKGRLE